MRDAHRGQFVLVRRDNRSASWSPAKRSRYREHAEAYRASDEQRRQELHDREPERAGGDARQLRRERSDRAQEHQPPAVARERRFARDDPRFADAERGEHRTSERVERVRADRVGDASAHDGARESPHGEPRRARRIGDRQRKEHHSARPGQDGALKQLPGGGRRAGPSGLGPAMQRSDEARQHGVNLVSQRGHSDARCGTARRARGEARHEPPRRRPQRQGNDEKAR